MEKEGMYVYASQVCAYIATWLSSWTICSFSIYTHVDLKKSADSDINEYNITRRKVKRFAKQ